MTKKKKQPKFDVPLFAACANDKCGATLDVSPKDGRPGIFPKSCPKCGGKIDVYGFEVEVTKEPKP